MAKDLDANVITQLNAQQKKPVLLFEIQLSGLTLRYVTHKTAITFPHGGASIYSPKTIQFGGISQSLEGQIGRVTAKFDNVSRDMATYAYYYVFEGCLLIIKRIYLDANGYAPTNSTEYIEVFAGGMEQPKEIGRQWFDIAAIVGRTLKPKVLQRTYGIKCEHKFGDNNTCNVNGFANLSSLTASGTADSGTTSTLIDNALTEVNDYWNNGAISITKAGITYKRKVANFNATTHTITLNLGLPVTINNTCTYTVYKGCDKTWKTCGGNNNHGPSGDNSLNFGGFIHVGNVPKLLEISDWVPDDEYRGWYR